VEFPPSYWPTNKEGAQNFFEKGQASVTFHNGSGKTGNVLTTREIGVNFQKE
jgi:hypothetical protein